jgi:hypothetical protein
LDSFTGVDNDPRYTGNTNSTLRGDDPNERGCKGGKGREDVRTKIGREVGLVPGVEKVDSSLGAGVIPHCSTGVGSKADFLGCSIV